MGKKICPLKLYFCSHRLGKPFWWVLLWHAIIWPQGGWILSRLKIWMFVTASVPKLTSKLRIKSKSIRVTHCYAPWEPPMLTQTHIETTLLDLVDILVIFYKINCIKRNIMCTVDSVFLLSAAGTPPEPEDMESNTSIYCMLFVYSFICLLFSDSVSHPCQAVGYLVMLSACVCLFVYLLVLV